MLPNKAFRPASAAGAYFLGPRRGRLVPNLPRFLSLYDLLARCPDRMAHSTSPLATQSPVQGHQEQWCPVRCRIRIERL
jgi:hypothetical protein